MSKRTIIISVVIAVFFVAAMAFAFSFSKRMVNNTFRKVGCVETASTSYWKMSYKLLKGETDRTIRPRSDEMRIRVSTEEGSLDMTIKNTQGEAIFSQDGITELDTQLDVRRYDEVIVQIHTDKHKGEFEIGKR